MGCLHDSMHRSIITPKRNSINKNQESTQKEKKIEIIYNNTSTSDNAVNTNLKDTNKRISFGDYGSSCPTREIPNNTSNSDNALYTNLKDTSKRLSFGDYGSSCPKTQNGEHIYSNNICICGKVSEIIEEDEEEYDEEGKPCPLSYTGNHHFVGANVRCKYCDVLKNNLMTIKKMSKRRMSMMSMFVLEEQLRSNKQLINVNVNEDNKEARSSDSNVSLCNEDRVKQGDSNKLAINKEN